MPHLFGVEDPFYFKHFLTIYNLRFDDCALKDRPVMWGQMSFVKHIVLSLAFPELRDVKTICGMSNKGGNLKWSKSFRVQLCH